MEISPHDYAEFEIKFPEAVAFLRTARLRYERDVLLKMKTRKNQWQMDRLKELEGLEL